MAGAEAARLAEDAGRAKYWKRWGPYLAERQWGTVREDYSGDGNVWEYFPHDHARSRTYRWGEDGLLGICDRQCRLCFALALWNGRDPILKERLFGLTGPEGNHGEDVKESYFYLDSTPTHSYLKALYKYPAGRVPVRAAGARRTAQRGKADPEFELADTGVFDEGRYFDVIAEYAKASPDDIAHPHHRRQPRPRSRHAAPAADALVPQHLELGPDGRRLLVATRAPPRGPGPDRRRASDAGPLELRWNGGVGRAARAALHRERNQPRAALGAPNPQPFVKDAFHRDGGRGRRRRGQSAGRGHQGRRRSTSSTFPRAASASCVSGFGTTHASKPFGAEFEKVLDQRIREADEFYRERLPAAATEDERRVLRQAYAGLLWSKQFYHYVVEHWLDGDPAQPPPPAGRSEGRNTDWPHVFIRDIISMPDKWEYPWFAAWDLAFHMIPFASIDPHFAKEQLLLLLREWYMHPNGQIPAYEFAFGDVNPPVHAWACWRVYKMTGPKGHRDRLFLERAFHKLLLNFTWWVNRKDPDGRNLFAGGFLGLDNIGVFDRSQPLPTGGHLEQADGTAWMAFYCNTMLAMALELASEDPAYEDVASKFFEHFIAISMP